MKKKLKDIVDAVDSGNFITVHFKKRIEEYESCIDTGMKAEIRGWDKTEDPDVIQIYFDLGRHIDHNRRKMKPNYYDDKGSSCQTVEENGLWPVNGVETIWFEIDDDPYEFLDVLSGI